MKKNIPNEIRRFILDSIPSIPYLEAMLLMKFTPQQHWDMNTLSERLFITKDAVGNIIKQLLFSGIIKPLESDPSFYFYCPENEQLKNIIDELASLYKTNLVEITNLVHSRSENVAQNFSDAFIWRKDK